MNMGDRIKKVRKIKKWSQQELAKKIGLTSGGMSSIESNKRDASQATIIKLSDVLEVSADYLLTGKEEQVGISQDEQEVIELYRKDGQIRDALKSTIEFKKKAINYLGGYTHNHAHAA